MELSILRTRTGSSLLLQKFIVIVELLDSEDEEKGKTMMQLEANLFPRFNWVKEDPASLRKALSDLVQMERFFTEAPLGQNAVVTLAAVEIDTGLEQPEVLESYQFVITRRFKIHGELHVGGAAGEVLNVYTFISGLRRYLEEEIAKDITE